MRAALVLFVGIFFVGVVAVATTIPELGDTRIESTRIPVPGTSTVKLDHTKYVVYYELQSGDLSSDEDVSVPGNLRVTLIGPGGDPVPLNGYSGSFSTDSGGRKAEAYVTVTPPREGEYRLAAIGGPSSVQATVVLGKPIGKKILHLVLGAIALVAGLLGSIVLGILVFARRRRKPPGGPAAPVAQTVPRTGEKGGTDAFGRPVP